jgi:hypothetical protein
VRHFFSAFRDDERPEISGPHRMNQRPEEIGIGSFHDL